MRKDKYIRRSGDGWRIKAIAFECPTSDVSLEISMPTIQLTHQEIPIESERLKKLCNEWYESSKVLSPIHFILHVTEPIGYKSKKGKHPVKIRVDINCYLREQIQMGCGADGFSKFEPEIERLVGILGLSSIVESAK